jgi:hypothetical protein
MKTKLFVSAVAMSCLTLILSYTAMAQMGGTGAYQQATAKGPTSSQGAKPGAQGAGGALVATQITPQEAAKKYPAPKSGYPMGERDAHKMSGLVNSPYPPHTEFDCSQVPRNGLVVDTRTNKVFVRP